MLAGAVVAVMVASGSNVGWVQQTEVQAATDLSQIPGYTGNPYTVVNDNEPDFAESDLTTDAFENYSDLDSLGRCGVAYANICKELMPTEKRGRIGMAKPSGWHTVNPPRLIHFREYRRGFQTPHELSFMPATLGRNGYLTTDTAQTQRLCRAASPSAGASGFALDAQSTA